MDFREISESAKRYEEGRYEQRVKRTDLLRTTQDIAVWADCREDCLHLHNKGRICLKGYTDCLLSNCVLRQQYIKVCRYEKKE